MFSKIVGVLESNEAEVVAILEALQLSLLSFDEKLVVESDSLNAILWVSCPSNFQGSLEVQLLLERD